MKLNKANIKHYRCEIIPTKILKNKIALNENQLEEKKTWYEINRKLQYFKIRNDFRLFSELFFQRFAKKIMNLDTLNYEVAYVSSKNPNASQNHEQTKCGLLSINFQDPAYNHYLVSELMKQEISDFIMYGGYTLENLLKFFKDYLTKDCYNENEIFLIKLFISDGFTYNVDRNPSNISFKIPKQKEISYKDRFHIEKLKKNFDSNILEYDKKQNRYFIIGLTPDVVFDNERILGIDHKNMRIFNHSDCWVPAFPYNNEVNFLKMEKHQIQHVKDKKFAGFDPNLLYLYINHQNICKPYFERLALDDEYKKIIESFTEPTSTIIISNDEKDYVTAVLQNRQKEFKKILKL